MFDEFKESQFLAYSLITNSIKNNKISHAYLIDGNNYEKLDLFVMGLVKLLVCPYNYSNNEKCRNCNICNRIDNGNYTELSVIRPINNIIKKEQLKELQENFSLSSVEGNKKIYVIWNAECMNAYSANSILKFLEEPTDNIIAILVTSNYSAMLPTIVSRCQYLKLANVDFFSRDTKLNVDKVLSACNLCEDDISSSEMVDVCINFVNFFESNGMDTLLNLKKIWYNNVTERKYYNFCFQIIIYFYYDVLKYKFFGTVNFFNDYIDNISSISDCLDVSDIVFRIQIFLKYYDLLKYNLNLNLLMDRVVIELGEVL